AYGEDGAGRAFLLVDELAGMSDLRAILGDTGLPAKERRSLAALTGRAVGDLHAAGFATPDLAAKHLFVSLAAPDVTLVDWQSARVSRPAPEAERIRVLAGLHASLSDDLASPRERLRFLWSYLRAAYLGSPSRVGALARTIADQAARLRQ